MEKQIMEGNKLIAEFMNFEYVESDGFWLDDGSMLVDLAHRMNNGIEFTELLFHESWDWLMAVVEKISALSIDHKDIFNDINCKRVEIFKKVNIFSTIQWTYASVIEFINWYNENK